MNYAFFGSPRFAAIILKKLIDAGMPPAVLVCNPDRPVGRKKIITPPETKSCIANRPSTSSGHINILQPENIDELQATSYKLHDLRCDFAIVAAYSKIIPKEIIELFPKGVIGVHPSLLPKYRGASPIQSAILHGEETTGVTLYLLDEKMDHGPLIAQRKSQIANRSYVELHDTLAELGGQLLVDTIPKFLRDEIVPQEQNHSQATFTKKFSVEDAFVDPQELEKACRIDIPDTEIALTIERKILALNPEPGVWTIIKVNGKGKMENGDTKKQIRIKLLEARIEEGQLVLTKIQYEGKQPIENTSGFTL